MPVELQVDATLAIDGDDELVQRCYQALTTVLDEPRLQADICVRLCDRAESRQLNHTYRGRDQPTNVLSFPAEVPPEAGLLGDIALCWPVVVAEAASQHKSVDQHYAHLLIHGWLHLLGYDHLTDDEAAVMEQQEIAALSLLGWPDPYVARP